MKTLYIDPVGGIAGDMLCAALFDAGLDFNHWKQELEKLEIPLPKLGLQTVLRGAFRARHFSVYNPHLNYHSHEHSAHEHSHQHSHQHSSIEPSPVKWEHSERSWKEIRQLISSSKLDPLTIQRALCVFEKLAIAEAKIHGTTADDVHFHEVGAIDSIVDIIGFCLGCTMLNIEQILYSEIPISGGLIWSEHGKIPLPAPATLELIKGVKTRQGIEHHEQVTPTGAAILVALGKQQSFPSLKTLSVGYGAGTRNPQEYANIVRVSIGLLESQENIDTTPLDIIEIQTNIDDMSGEELPFLQDQLFKQGALDVSFQSIFMKKGRPAWLLTVLCEPHILEKIAHCIFQNTTSFGLRYIPQKRIVLERTFQKVDTPFGMAQIKLGSWKDIKKISVEYEDMKRIAEAANLSLSEAKELILQQWKQL